MINLVGLGLEELPDAFDPSLLGSSLVRMSLASNKLTSLPASLGGMTSLTELSLVNNSFAELPRLVCQLTRLTELHLHTNRLVSLPSEVARLKQLTSMVLDCNRIAALPSSMATMPLERLNLNRNALLRLPAWVPGMRKLAHLSACDNAIDEFPAECISCKSLRSLSLGNNAIFALPSTIGRFTQLEALVLDWNRIEVLPLQVRHLTGLKTLRLEGNPLRRPTLRFVLDNGPQGLFNWANRASAEEAQGRKRQTFLQFNDVMEVIQREGMSPSSISTFELSMAFDGQASEYTAIVWEELMASAWPAARRLWITTGLPVRGERHDPHAAMHAVKAAGFSLGVDAGTTFSLDVRAEDLGALRRRSSDDHQGGDAGGSETDSDDSGFEFDLPAGASGAASPGADGAGLVVKKQYTDDPGTFWSRPQDELLGLLAGFNDAAGPVARENVFGIFKECACRSGGRRRVCAPPREGFRCTRRCVVVKRAMTTRKGLEEDKQWRWQQVAIEDASADARRAAERFAASEEGDAYFQKTAREQADKDEKQQHRLEFLAAVTQSFQASKDKVRRKYNKLRAEHQALQQTTLGRLRKQERQLEDKLTFARPTGLGSLQPDAGATGVSSAWQLERRTPVSVRVSAGGRAPTALHAAVTAGREALREVSPGEAGGSDAASKAAALSKAMGMEGAERQEQLETGLATVRREIKQWKETSEADRLDNEEAAGLDAIEQKIAEMQARYLQPSGVTWGIRCALSPSFRKRAADHKRTLKDAYVARRVAEARADAEHRSQVMKAVMARWRDLGIKRVFFAWRDVFRTDRANKRKANSADVAATQLKASSGEANEMLRRAELAKWAPHTDPYTDTRGFVHAETGQWRSDTPRADDMVFRHQEQARRE